MKVILLKDVEKLGTKGDIKEVADGYARNFLIPEKLAVLASKSEIAKLEEQKEIETRQAEEELARYQETATQMDGLELEIPVKIDEDGKLFGAVNANQISEKLQEKGFEIKKGQVKLEEPIKEIGEHEVIVELPHNLEARVKVIVIKEVKEKEKEA
jgi:large subunit ribosomal protein L9